MITDGKEMRCIISYIMYVEHKSEIDEKTRRERQCTPFMSGYD